MKFRNILLVTILILALSVSAFAQRPAPRAQGQPGPIAANMIRQLGLSQDQVQQIHAIVAKFHQDAMPIWGSNATQAEKEAQVKDLRVKAGQAIMNLLSADQQAKATKMRFVDIVLAPPAARPEMGLLTMIFQLDLSADQKTAIKGIMTDAQAAEKAIRSDTSLDQAAKQAKSAQLRKDTNEKLMAVLTPAQKAKLKQMMGNRGAAG